MGGGTAYKGLPPPNPTVSYWQTPPSDIAHHRTTKTLPQTADYVVVGSGITGAGIALRLLEQLDADGTARATSSDKSHSPVVMLEARTTASGASGRNGGHCRAGWWAKFAEFHSAFGAEEAVKFEHFEQSTVNAVAKFVRDNQIQCDFQDVETADVTILAEEWELAMQSWKLRQQYEKQFGLAPRKMLDCEEAAEYLKIPVAKGAVVFEAHTLNPYKLATSIIKMCLDRGLNLQATTPVVSVKRVDEQSSPTERKSYTSNKYLEQEFPWIVETERGLIHARKVVLATNAYTNALYPALADQQFLIPTRAQVVAARPGDAIAGNPALKRSVGIEGGKVGDYALSRASGLSGEGDVIYGGGRRLSSTQELWTIDDTTVHPVISAYLKDAPPRYFGKKEWGAPGTVLREWTGIMGYTKDRLPLIGEAPGREGLWLAVGFNGHGMAMSFRATEALVGMMLGNDDGRWPDWLPKAFRAERAWEEHKILSMN